MGKNILVLLPLDEKQRNCFESKAPDAAFIYSDPENVTETELSNAEIIFGNPNMEDLPKASKLEWIQLHTAGSDTYAKSGLLKESTKLTNASGAYGLNISEHMIGMLLMLYKKFNVYQENKKLDLWKDEGHVRSIYGSTVLVIGLGDIGGEFAKRMKALGAAVWGVRRKDNRKPDYLDELYFMDDVDNLLPKADVVALSLPSTKQTIGFMDSKRFGLMKKDAVVINVGRGNAIDTEALCDTLEKGNLLGACLDVTEPEPLPVGHRLWKYPNAIITPHVSGGDHLPLTKDRIVEIAADNLSAYLKGTKLKNEVDFVTGYRSDK